MIDNSTYQQHLYWMQKALALAENAGKNGDVPVGVIITDSDNKLITQAENRKYRDQNPVNHAEILAISQASQILNSCYLTKCNLYVTLEPCPMCTGAIIQARIGLLVYGVDDPKTGTIRTVYNLPDSSCSNHRLEVIGGINESACKKQLQSWFEAKRG